jgi:hypothetical protein
MLIRPAGLSGQGYRIALASDLPRNAVAILTSMFSVLFELEEFNLRAMQSQSQTLTLAGHNVFQGEPTLPPNA